MKRYLLSFCIFIFVLTAIIFFYLLSNLDYRELTWQIFLYFILVTLLFHYGIVRTTQSRPQVFIRYFMAATTFKLLLHLGVIVVYSFFHRNQAIPFIFTFMIMYVLFTFFEVMSVWRKVKK